MILDRVTSDVLFHVRTENGVTLDLTPNEQGARTHATKEGAQLFRIVRSAGSTTRIA